MKFLFCVFVLLLPIVTMADIASTSYVGNPGIEGTVTRAVIWIE